MTKFSIKGKYSGSSYPFICFETDELLDPSEKALTDNQSYLFMLAEIITTSPVTDESQVKNVRVIGSTISTQVLKDKVSRFAKHHTHINC